MPKSTFGLSKFYGATYAGGPFRHGSAALRRFSLATPLGADGIARIEVVPLENSQDVKIATIRGGIMFLCRAHTNTANESPQSEHAM